MGYSGKGAYQDWYFNHREKKDWKNPNLMICDRRTFGQATRGRGRPSLPHPLGKARRTIWSIPTRPFAGSHFAIYPSELLETPIKAGCPEGGIILDPFIVSGTSALVALKLNRRFLGVKLKNEYITMANQRIAEQLGADRNRTLE